MAPVPKNLLLPWVVALFLSCTPHTPWDRSVPSAARTRWRLGQDIFASVSREIKPLDPNAFAQDFAVRRAAEAALLSITAHVRLPADPARARRLIRQLEKAGFSFAASRLRTPVKVAAPDDRFRLAVRDWSGLSGFPLTTAQVKATSTAQLVQLIRTHLHDPSGAVAIWALELVRRSQSDAYTNLDCASWQQVALLAADTHSERVLADLWPALRAACTLDELQAWEESLDGALPEVVRLFGETADFARRVRVCTTTGARFPAQSLREAFLQLAAPGLDDLALGFLCSGPEFLEFSSPDPVLEALRLHLSGKTDAALAHLAQKTPQDTALSRLNAGRLALSFGDRAAAAGHFRWAAAWADRPDLKKTAYFHQRSMARFTADEEWTALTEQYRLDPVGTTRELWLSGHWPALQLLAGRAPVPYAAEAARALLGYAACRPDGGALVPTWRRLVGPENLQKVWPSPQDATACRAPQPGRQAASQAPTPWTPAWNGDFHSDLALLLYQALPPASWDAFYRRHATHPQITTAAELALVLHPDSHRHGLAAARAFLMRNDTERAWALLRITSSTHPDRAAALLEIAELFLNAGFRHEAARAMRDWFDWKEAFVTPAERHREDWRLEANLKLIEFFARAGLADRAGQRLTELLTAARDGDPLRFSRVATLAARRFPAFVTPETLARTTQNPLLLLQLAARRPGFEKWRDHVLSQLAIALPDAPEVAWTACIWQGTGAACLDAQALGVVAPAGVRLPILLSILDHLQSVDTSGKPDDLRLALHAARFLARTSSDWQFVAMELENE